MFKKIDSAIKELKEGKFIIIVDDKDRENEGDMVLAAEKADATKLNKMIQRAKGLMCIPTDQKRLEELDIPLMVPNNSDKFDTPFTISVDAKKNTTTGMSVHDRLETIKVMLDPNSKPDDLARPGHLFPLRAAKNGVLDRKGHTEAAVDLCRLAGLFPMAIIAEVMNSDGSMAKLKDLEKFSSEHKLNIYTIEDLVTYRESLN